MYVKCIHICVCVYICMYIYTIRSKQIILMLYLLSEDQIILPLIQ